MPPLPLATQSRPADYAGERLINYTFDPSQNVLLGRSGLKAVYTLEGTVRAFEEMAGRLYAVAGGYLWDVPREQKLGFVGDDAETTMAATARYLMVVSRGKYYVYDGTSLSTPATGQVTVPTSVATLDGYAVVAGEDATRSDRIAVSNVDDPTTFDGLDFATAETLPDGIRRVIRDHTELAVFGDRTTERFYNSGEVFPFAPNASAFAERGCSNGATVAAADNGIYWLGDDGLVYRAFGGQPEVVSTSVISEWIANRTVESGFAIEDRGRKFYVLRLADGPSLAFNIGAGLWSEFSTGGTHEAWIGSAAYQMDGIQCVGTSTGKVCVFSGWEDDGQAIRGDVPSQPIREKIVRVGNIELQMDSGHGQARVHLQTSQDGRNWSKPRQRDLGKSGNYGRAARWHGCGTHRNMFQARVWITDPVQRDIHGVYYG